jgi:hypothetical protein
VNLDDIVAAIDSFDDELVIFVRHPWTAESPAHVGNVAPGGLEEFCRVSDAKERLRLYIGDPARMRVARVVAYADALRMERERADLATRTFTYGGYPVGYFDKGELPSRPGRYRYMPYRGEGHLLMIGAIERIGKARCRFPNGDRFRVIAIPEPHVLEIGDVAP